MPDGIVFGAPLKLHIDTTAIALLALTEGGGQPYTHQAITWLRQACVECSSAYSLAWSTLALLLHQDLAADLCVERLRQALSPEQSNLTIETLSLSAIAINAAEGKANPFQVIWSRILAESSLFHMPDQPQVALLYVRFVFSRLTRTARCEPTLLTQGDPWPKIVDRREGLRASSPSFRLSESERLPEVWKHSQRC